MSPSAVRSDGHPLWYPLRQDTARPGFLHAPTIRTLSMDAVQTASSGHRGTPMSMAPVVCTLWQRFLRMACSPVHVRLSAGAALRSTGR